MELARRVDRAVYGFLNVLRQRAGRLCVDTLIDRVYVTVRTGLLESKAAVIVIKSDFSFRWRAAALELLTCRICNANSGLRASTPLRMRTLGVECLYFG